MHQSRFFALLFALCVAGCGGTVNPDPATAPSSSGFSCPVIPTQLGVCSDFHALRTALSCGGDGTMQVAISTAPGGANRFVVQLMNGSRVQGTLIHWDPPCNLQDGTDIDFTFGVVYTADQGVDTDDQGVMTPCIKQSKMEWSSFNFDLAGNVVHEGLFKELMHQTFDKEIINQIYASTSSSAMGGRCSNWRVMP
jgi:hypothetical protein